MPATLTLLTGFPGFIGERLVKRLIETDPERRVVVLVEEKMEEVARSRAASIDAERVEVLRGDIVDRRLGVSAESYARLRDEVSEVFHLAAMYDLGVPLEPAQRVNVDGTGNVLDLCLRADGLERLNYVSTAYVAGDRHGIVYEHELVVGQGFKNHYESTKFQAELWVERFKHRVPTTIYRPGIVVGDSSSGETPKFDGPYYLLRTISLSLRHKLPLAQIGTEAPFNVVPVDLVVAAIAALSRDPEAAGETLHLVDPDPLSSADLIDLLAEQYSGRRPRLRLPAGAVDVSLRFKPARKAFAGIPRQSLRYLSHDVSFDTRRAEELLGRQGMRFPGFRDYAPAIVSFFREHEDDPDYT